MASLLAGVAEGLTRIATTDEIDSTDSIPTQSVCGDFVDVVIAGDSGPMFSQDGSGEWFDFTERDGSHSSSFKAEREAADSRKEVEDIHLFPQNARE